MNYLTQSVIINYTSASYGQTNKTLTGRLGSKYLFHCLSLSQLVYKLVQPADLLH